jgi:hypothetical protein
MRVELGLAWAGVRHRPASWILLALGVAIAVALPVFAAGLRLEAATAAVRSAIDALPPASRAVLAVTSTKLQGAELDQAGATVREGFRDASLVNIRQTVTFRPLAFGGQDLIIGAIDQLAQDVHVTSGRLPTECTATRCDVVVVTRPGARPVDLAAVTGPLSRIGLVVAGSAEFTDERLAGVGLVEPEIPLVLSSQPAPLAAMDSLVLYGRNTAWFGTLDGAAIAEQGVPAFTRTLASVAEEVNLARGPLNVSWPQETVAAAEQRAEASAERFTVLGAGAGILQLGFCLVVAAGMRRRQQLIGQLLSRRGASPGQLNLVMAAQPAIAVGLGLVLGVAAGFGIVGARGGRVHAEPWVAAARAVESVWPTVLGVSAAAAVLVTAMFRWPAEAGRAAQWVLNGALLVALGAAVLLLNGTTDAASGSLAVSAILAVVLATGLLAARLWPPIVGLLRPGWARRRGPVTQVAVTVAMRRPLLRMLTAGFVAAACCLLVFVGGYRGSLQQSAFDQAAMQVPLDASILPSSRVAAPLAVVDIPGLQQAAPGVEIHPVVSSAVSAFAGSPLAKGLPLVGIDLAALSQVHQFAAVTGADRPAAALAAALVSTDRPRAPAPTIPAGDHTIAVPVTGLTDAVVLGLWVSTPEGRAQRLDLTGVRVARARISSDVAMTVRALEITESSSQQVHRQHGVGEGRFDRPLTSGELVLGPATVDATAAAWSWTGWVSPQAEVAGDGAALRIRYQVADRRVVIVPGHPDDAAAPLPVAVDPDTAARAGAASTFAVTVNGTSVPVAVVAILPRMPGLGKSYLVADREAVTHLLDRTAPGTAVVTQLWVAAPAASLPAVRDALEASPASAATLRYRSDLAATIAADPVALRSIALLTVAGAVALLLAMVAAGAAVRADHDETAGDQFALELDGLPPARLRRLLLLRTALVVLLGVPVGVLGGLVLTAVAVQIVVAGPGGAPVEPPLRVVLGLGTTLGVAAAALLGGLMATVAAAATAFREPRPQAAEVDLR